MMIAKKDSLEDMHNLEEFYRFRSKVDNFPAYIAEQRKELSERALSQPPKTVASDHVSLSESMNSMTTIRSPSGQGSSLTDDRIDKFQKLREIEEIENDPETKQIIKQGINHRFTTPDFLQLVDLHIYVVPRSLWQDDLNSVSNDVINNCVSAGFVR